MCKTQDSGGSVGKAWGGVGAGQGATGGKRLTSVMLSTVKIILKLKKETEKKKGRALARRLSGLERCLTLPPRQGCASGNYLCTIFTPVSAAFN